MNHLIWFYTACAQNGISLSDDQLGLFERFAGLVIEWNKKVNVISRRDEENLWARHILHSVSMMFKLVLPPGARVLDLGSGGGLPGIPIKIVRPDLVVTLLDSTQKKINVVKEIIGSLGLSGIDAVWGRAEDVGRQKDHAGQFDVVVARAVAELEDLVRWSGAFVRGKGPVVEKAEPEKRETPAKLIVCPTLIAFKGGDVEKEINKARNRPGVTAVSVIDLALGGSIQLDDRDKKLVVVEYSHATKKKAE